MHLRIDDKLRLIFDHLPGFWGCKDVDSVFMYANQEYAELMGCKHPLDVVDRTDFDMPCATANFASVFQAQDREVMVSRKPLRVLDIHLFAGQQWRACMFTKSPLLDENRQVIGTIFQGVDVSAGATVELGSLLGRLYTGMGAPDTLSRGSYQIGGEDRLPGNKLTRRESEVLFFLIRGHSAKDIARIFGMSVRTVEDHLASLRHKFGCAGKASLIDKAIYLGYLNRIPESLFTRQLSVVLRD